jgi:hypothetical protein
MSPLFMVSNPDIQSTKRSVLKSGRKANTEGSSRQAVMSLVPLLPAINSLTTMASNLALSKHGAIDPAWSAH